MNRIFDLWANPGELLHSVLKGSLLADATDEKWVEEMLEPLIAPRRRRGFQGVRVSRVSVSRRLRAAR